MCIAATEVSYPAAVLFAFVLPLQTADGVISDAEPLYLVVAASDSPRRRQLATAGVTVWFDAVGGKKQLRHPHPRCRIATDTTRR